MSKRGFTLVELLGVIVLLALSMTVAFPRIINIIKSSTNKSDELTKTLIYDAASSYIEDNKNDFNKKNGNIYCISLSTLVSENYLKAPIKLEGKDTDVTTMKAVEVLYKDRFEYSLKNNDECKPNVGAIITNLSVDNNIENISKYSFNSIESKFNLLNEDSEIVYKVEVTNFDEMKMGITNITGIPESLEYSIADYTLNDKICDNSGLCNLGANKEFYLILKYKSGKYDPNLTEFDINLKFEITPFYRITYTYLYDNSYENEILGGNEMKLNLDNNQVKVLVERENGSVLALERDYTFSNGVLTIPNIDNNLNIQVNTKSMIITDARLISNVSIDLDNTQIIRYYNSLFNNKVVLSKTDNKSSSTYRITVKNNSSSNYYFNKIIERSYSNPNISYKISGISRGDELKSGSSMSFNVTFYYKNEVLPDTSISNYNILDSNLDFAFSEEEHLVE